MVVSGVISDVRRMNALFELICERLFVEKDIGIMEALVKAVFHLFHTPHDTLDIRVARQHDEGRICSTVQFKRWVLWPVVLTWDRIW
jgi:hypothetical protein